MWQRMWLERFSKGKTMIYRLKNSLATIAAITLAVLLIAMGAVSASTIQLAKGTPAKVRFAEGLDITSGEFGEGEAIPIVLDQPIDKNGRIIVEAGTKGTAKVVEVRKAGRGGKGGYIKIEFVDLEPKGKFRLSDGDAIGLTGKSIDAEGKGKGFFFWLILKFILKGSEAEIPTGEVYEVELTESVMMTDEF